MVASAVTCITGCGAGDDVATTMGLRTSEAVVTRPDDPLTVTDTQREYLDALAAAGLRPSSELLALTIGSYVCQAHAAKQSEQAIWALVLPLVRSDLRATTPTAAAPSARIGSPPAASVDSVAGAGSPPQTEAVNSATTDYIRIATDRLC